MFIKVTYFLLFVTCVVGLTEEDYANDFLIYLNKKMSYLNNMYYLAEWNYTTNLSKRTFRQYMRMSEYVSRQVKEDNKHASCFNWKTYKNSSIKRQFKLFTNLDIGSLPVRKYVKLTKIISHMQEVYSKAKLCSFTDKSDCSIQLEPNLTQILATSNCPQELEYYWLEWRKAVGSNLKGHYYEYVQLMNEAAKLNQFADAGEMALSCYERKNIKTEIEKLWRAIKPLYLQLHAYVRDKLRKFYGNNIVSENGPIPAHLLGNMWGQSWEYIANISLPCPDKPPPDITRELKAQCYNATTIFKTAENFFLSINMSKMPECFWENSVLEKPEGREIVCHASAWDFADGKDYRIKQCTRIDLESFVTAHHEMGHIEYYLQYKNQPPIFQAGANPAFHEAVGDTIALSVTSLEHLEKLQFLKNGHDDADELNHLFIIAMAKIPFMPFGYLVDLWRWDVFAGVTGPSEYNCKWWKLRVDLQGIEPPQIRTEADFDPVSKYHVVANSEYISYFMSHILQFQFHKRLCELAGEYPTKPLHKCDIYGSVDAGNAFKTMLKLGNSRIWMDALEVLTGERKMDASPFLEYFEPLAEFLREENKRNKVNVGWKSSKKICQG